MGGRKAEEAGAERERKPDEVVVLSDPPVESFSMPPSSDFETITSPSLPASLPPKQLGTLVVAHRGVLGPRRAPRSVLSFRDLLCVVVVQNVWATAISSMAQRACCLAQSAHFPMFWEGCIS